MEIKSKLSQMDKTSIKTKMQEFVEESKENFISKTNQIYSLIKSLKEENELLLSKSKRKIFIQIFLFFYSNLPL